jgi:hypothetical protein
VGARFLKSFIVSLYFFALYPALASKKSARSVVNFVWKNPSSCKIDTLLQVLLFEDYKEFPLLSQFWKESSLCNTQQNKNHNAFLVKQALVNELKRSFEVVNKKRPAQLGELIHNKRFQKFVLLELKVLYFKYLKGELKNFHQQLSEARIIALTQDKYFSSFKDGDIRRIVDFKAHRSVDGRHFDGAASASGAYSSIVRIGDRIGLVNRVTWYAFADPRYEPRFMTDSLNGTYEVGLSLVGNDKFGAELMGIFEVSSSGKPNKLLALSISSTPMDNEDLEISLIAWTDENYKEKFIGLSASYSFDSNPLEPFIRFFKRKKETKERP